MNRFMFASGVFAVALGGFVIHEALGAILLGVILMIWAVVGQSCDEDEPKLYRVRVTYGAQPWSDPHYIVYHTTDPLNVPSLGDQAAVHYDGAIGRPRIRGIIIAVTLEPV